MDFWEIIFTPKEPAKHLIAILAYVWILFGCVLPATAVNNRIASADQTFHILVNDRDREYLIYIPPSCKTNRGCPVVLIFHGGGGSAKGILEETGWAEIADTEGFIAVFPEGTPPEPAKPASFLKNPQTWNDGSDRTSLSAVKQNAPDVAFVSAILADLKTKYSVDETRIYATGFSNGASMTFRIARELSQEIAAIAPVSGADWLPDAIPARPVPILYITGTADPLNPIEGGEIHLGQRSLGVKPPIQETIDRWLKIHGYTNNSAVIYQDESTTGIAFGPEDSPGVVLYTIEGHGHHWPGGNSALPKSIAGPNTAAINATDIIWEFFKLYEKPAID